MIISILKIFALICTAVICGKFSAKLRLPAILGWLVAGIVFGTYLAGVVTLDITDAMWYKMSIKFFETIAGVMIGKEIVLKKLASSGKQIIGITVVQSIGTFLFVSLIFSVVLAISGLPVYLAFIFGGIALATAPAPALSIVNEYHTHGLVTNTLIPLAAIDDVYRSGCVFYGDFYCRRSWRRRSKFGNFGYRDGNCTVFDWVYKRYNCIMAY